MYLAELLEALVFVTVCWGRRTATVDLTHKHTETTHYYTFWKAVNSKLIPKTNLMKTSVRKIIQDYCTQSDCLAAAKQIYDDIRFPSFPSKKTLQEESKESQIPFIRSLLGETVSELRGYGRLLDKHFKTHCPDSKSKLTKKTCDPLESISTNVKKLAGDIMKQVYDYFNSSFKKLPKRSVVEKKLKKYRKSKNERSLALLYALYTHLHETRSALQFSLEFTRPGHSLSTGQL